MTAQEKLDRIRDLLAASDRAAWDPMLDAIREIVNSPTSDVPFAAVVR